jgi:trehalose 6-phosphate phosphatase
MPADPWDLHQTLVALDFDGTLAPLVPDPATSRPVPGAVAALTELAASGAQVAIITGRDARTVVGLGGLDRIPRLIVAGLYGLEWWQDGQLSTVETPAVIHRLRDALPEALRAADPGLWLEDKRLSLVVHARRSDDPAAALRTVRPAVERIAAGEPIEVHDGHQVLELRLPGHDKGRALRELIERTGRAAVVFAGDDLGDLPAFAVVAERARAGRRAVSIGVTGDPESAVASQAMRTVPGPADALAAVQSALGR